GNRRERIACVRTTTTAFREPHAAIAADENVVRSITLEGERVKVRVLIVAEVQPGISAIIRTEDTARSNSIIELTGRIDDVGAGGIDLDHIIVEALPTAVIFNCVLARAGGQNRPTSSLIGGFPDARGMVCIGGVIIIEAEIQNSSLPCRV